MAKTYIYHFHSKANTTDGFEATYDGIVEVKEEIETMEDYIKLKDWIVSKNPSFIRNSLAITNLSLLKQKVQ